MKKAVRLGDIIQIEYSNKVIGYLFKEDEDSVTICNTLDFENGTPTKTVLKESIKNIETFESSMDKKEQKNSNPVRAEKNDEIEERVKIIQFPNNGEDVS